LVVLRCTGKLLALLGGRAVALSDPPASDDDWYANLLWVDRRKCLLLAHAGTLFPVFVAAIRKTELRPLGVYLVKRVEAELRSEGLPPDSFGRLDPDAVQLAKTASRTILGFMNEMAAHCDYAVADAGGLRGCDVGALNHRLRRTLHNRGGDYVSPLELVAQRLDRGHWERSPRAPRLIK
jgi:hypothetical protein